MYKCIKHSLILLFLVLAFTVRIPISIWEALPDQADFIRFIVSMYNDSEKNNCKRVKIRVSEDKATQEIVFEFECLEKKLIDI